MEHAFEDGQLIRDDPNRNPSSLRFSPGDLVMYKLDVGWVEGEVVKSCQRFHGGYEPQTILYIVWPHSDVPDEQYGSHWIEEDTDDFIRRRMDIDKNNWHPDNFHPFNIKPKDPLEYLYTGTVFNSVTEDGKDQSEVFRQIDQVRSAQANPDGTTLVDIGGKKVLTYTIEFPDEPIFGVDGQGVIMTAMAIHRRRARTSKSVPDMIQIFHSAVPKTTSLQELEALSKQSDENMLLLADALMSGVHGWPRDVKRSCACYRAAAWGCQESEDETVFGTMVGLPEAMVATSYTLYMFLKKEIMGLEIDDRVRTSEILRVALQTERGMSIVSSMLFYINAALCRGYVAPMTQDVAQAVKEVNLAGDQRFRDCQDETIQQCVENLLALLEYMKLEITVREAQEYGTIPKGDPDDETLELFGKKLDVIYRDIPVASFVLHLEYRQISRVPFPIVVYAIVPQRKRAIKIVRLPDNLQISAFSNESFRYVWLRIAFAIHLGDDSIGGRNRPTEITVLDSPGNRHFASFLRDELVNSGTNVRLVSHSESISIGSGRRRNRRQQAQQELGIVIQQIENPLLEIPNYLIEEGSSAIASASELQQSRIRQRVDHISARIGNDPRRCKSHAEDMKSQGNTLFSSSDFVGGIQCYSIAIELLRLVPKTSDETNLLIGTLLSNRAACYLAMEQQRSSPEFQKLLLHNAVLDCTVALKSSWANRVLPARIREKLKFRQDKASARLDVLQCEFQSEIASIIFPEPSRRHEEAEVSNATVRSQDITQELAQIDPRRVSDPEKSSDLLLLKGQTIYDNRLAKNYKDGCPICLRECNEELSHTYCSILPCGEHALCVECICTMKKTADKEKTEPTCPLCRTQFNGKIVQDLAYQIIEIDKELAVVVERFPADFEESIAVAHSLLWKKEFRVDEVIETLDRILDDQVSSLYFRPEVDLTHQEKDEIYRRARMPVRRLHDELKKLVEERRTTFESSRLRHIEVTLRKTRSDLSAAREKARDDIYESLNSVGSMGAQNDSHKGGNIQVDYHGLHVSEMHEKYEELVEAILPVVKRVTIITGRGSHSADGNSKLKKALKKKIEKDKKTRWEHDPKNPGLLVIKWVADNRIHPNATL